MTEVLGTCAPRHLDPHEVRVAVAPQPGADRVSVDAAIEAAMVPAQGDVAAWSVEPLLTDEGEQPQTLVIRALVRTGVGSLDYARMANDLAHRLRDDPAIAEVDADLPVHAFAQRPDPERIGAFAAGDHGDNHRPGTESWRWSHDAVGVPQAWSLQPPAGGKVRGEGIRIGHPDSGYTGHPNLGTAGLDLQTDRDLIAGDDDALDPLVSPQDSPWPLPSPGHGTATGSVIAGRGTEEAGIVGVAPRASLVPIRAVESVVQLFDSDVARAVDWARRHDCHVISMSLGGKGFFGLKGAIQRAVDDGLIVMAAAGNKVGVVTAPASYSNCIAVAGVGIGHRLWEGSSRGAAVDVSAPAECVHVAAFDWQRRPPGHIVDRSHGTSFAVAHLAGIAALWLAFHGRNRLIQRYGRGRLQAVFLHLIRTVAHRRPSEWHDDWGVGVVDAQALLSAELPAPDDVPVQVAAFVDEDPASRLAALLTGVSADNVRDRAAAFFGVGGDQVGERLARFEGELAYLLLDDDDFRERFLHGVAPAALSARRLPRAASTRLAREIASM
ncbi:MAG TPA: S8/S53 family peptidase [Nitriliruptorales bacterium]|nr:S8/S53 family peptidase [Nitriliruptorales bacterium]